MICVNFGEGGQFDKVFVFWAQKWFKKYTKEYKRDAMRH